MPPQGPMPPMPPPLQSGGIPELPMDDDDEEEKPKEQQKPREPQSAGPQQEKKERFIPPKVKCPKCSNIIFVDKNKTTPDGKVKLECPGCGTTGSI